MNNTLKFWLKIFFMYGLFSLSFSLIGIGLDYFLDNIETDNTIGIDILKSASLTHVLGHIAFGMVVALPTLAYRYIIASGGFAILLDADHLIQFFGIENIARLGHGFIFAILVVIVMMFLFGKKDYFLGVISFAAVLSHISFDILIGGGSAFPLFAPITMDFLTFQYNDWLLVLTSGVIIVASVKIVVSRKIYFEKLNK